MLSQYDIDRLADAIVARMTKALPSPPPPVPRGSVVMLQEHRTRQSVLSDLAEATRKRDERRARRCK